MKRTAAVIICCSLLAGCGRYNGSFTVHELAGGADTSAAEEAGAFESEDTFTNECSILLGDTITVIGGGALVEADRISVTQGGVYVISGSLDGGMICVESDAPVKLILDGAEIHSGSAAISDAAGKLIIECADGTENFLYSADGSAALYGGDKLVICGGGSLTVDGGSGAEVGIEAKGRLQLDCGNITVKNVTEMFRAESIDKAEGVFIATDR